MVDWSTVTLDGLPPVASLSAAGMIVVQEPHGPLATMTQALLMAGAAAAGAAAAAAAFPILTGPSWNFADPVFTLESLGATTPANGVYIARGGIALSFQTIFSSPAGAADSDNQRATLLVRSITSDDGNSEEQTLCVLTTIQTGYSTGWSAGASYHVGDNVRTNGQVYRCMQAGISAASGSGPSATTDGIADGGVIWNWINAGAIDAKTGSYFETDVRPGAGNAWGGAFNTRINAGVLTNFAVGLEFDFENNCGTDSEFGGLDKYNLLLTTVGSNVSSACLEINTRNTTNPAALWGIHFSQGPLASHAIIGIDASAPNGIAFGIDGGGVVNPTFSNSVINDSSRAVTGYTLAGEYSAEAINITGVTPVGMSISGAKSFASIYCTATTPSSYVAAGVYTSSAFSVTATSDPAAFSSSGTNSLAAFYDKSVTPTAFLADGDYSGEAVSITGSSPAAVSTTGHNSLCTYFDQSTAPFGWDFAGNYGKSPIKFTTLPPSYASNAAAASAGLDVGGVFLINGVMTVREA